MHWPRAMVTMPKRDGVILFSTPHSWHHANHGRNGSPKRSNRKAKTMIDNLKTQVGDRPDLEAIQVNPVIGYIGGRIYPTVSVNEKQGRVYYKTLTSHSAAQTSRSSESAPSRTMLTDSSSDAYRMDRSSQSPAWYCSVLVGN